MFSLKVITLLCIVATLRGLECCDAFKNVKAIVYTGSEMDPQEIVLENGLQDAATAYRIEIYDQDIPELCGLSNLKDLDTLVIKRSGIKKISKGALSGVPHLRILDLSHNKIRSISNEVFNNINLRRLNLSSNSISKIDEEAFDNMLQLQVIELAGNHIEDINPNWFQSTPKLYRIDLCYNEITKLPKDAFKNLANKKDRNLDIWLNNNKINDIHPLAFKNIEKIETLWISDNNIVEIKEYTFDGIEKIHSLYLDDNKIVCLSDEILSGLSVDELNIDGNPLDCNCLRKIRKWGQKKNVETQTARRGFSCLRNKIDDVITAQKKYYEEKLMDAKF